MTTTLKDHGSCPICARTVPRLQRRVGRILREVYCCPGDGVVAYGPQRTSLGDWASALSGSPLAAAHPA